MNDKIIVGEQRKITSYCNPQVMHVCLSSNCKGHYTTLAVLDSNKGVAERHAAVVTDYPNT